jgi:hypothetical protein
MKHANIFRSKALKNISKLVFWYANMASGNPDWDRTSVLLLAFKMEECNKNWI